MTSALESRPKLRADLKIVRREHRGNVHYVVKQPQEDKFYQFGETEVGLMQLMNGERTPEEISYAADEALGVRPPPGQIADFAQRLKRLGLVERTPAERHLMLMERLRSQRKVRAGRRSKGSILRLRFSIGDPDQLFERTVERLPWLWSPAFAWTCVALFVTYVIIIAARWPEFWGGFIALYTLQGLTVWDWVLLYALSLVIIGVHELGHGLTTKHFGGEVHEIGGMLIYFSPALFCNTNDAWLFERRSDRLWVTFAGPWIQLTIACLASIVWFATEPGTFVHRIAFLSVLSGGTGALLANLNPLIPLDGYYALSDWLEIPNLRRRAFEYWTWLGKRFTLGIDTKPPAVTPRERRVFLIYGGLAILYGGFIIVASALWFVLVLGRILGPVIWLIFAIFTVRTIIRLSRRSRALAVAATTTWRSGFLSGWTGWAVLIGAVLLVGLPFVVPWTLRAHGQFRVEAQSRAWIRAQVPGVLDRLYVHEGDTVRAGAPVASLWNPDLESSRLELQARAARLQLTKGAAEARGDLAAAATAGAALDKLREQLSVADAAQANLVLRAPISGIVLGHRLRERLGRSMGRGDLLLQVASLDGRIARVRIPPSEAGDVAPGQWANFKLSARPDLKFRARVLEVAPAAEQGWLEAVIPVPGSGWQPAPGMVGTAKIATVHMTVARAIFRSVQGVMRLDLWL